MFGGDDMLTGCDDEVQLAQSDVAYVGFRLAALDTLCQMDICQDFVEGWAVGPQGRIARLAKLSICCCSSRTCHFDW